MGLCRQDHKFGQSPDECVGPVGAAFAVKTMHRQLTHLLLQRCKPREVMHPPLLIERGNRLCAGCLAFRGMHFFQLNQWVDMSDHLFNQVPP